MSGAFIKAPARHLAAWERRAVTILLKAQGLLSAMIDEIGADNTETDFADAVVERAEELADMLARWRKAQS